ncbi:MAG: hypothetical protein IKP00_05515 [Victivallales bacterium]|nr:hypothetical protein [Victivallales bacterium]
MGFARAKGARFTHGYVLAAASRLFLRLAAPLRYAARRKGTGGIACPWVSLAPEALASPTAMFLSPLRGFPI